MTKVTIKKSRISRKKKVTEVYTDGSAADNGKACARAGYGVFFGDGDPRNLSEPFFSYPLTNNRAELYACIRAIEQYMLYSKLRTKQSKLIINSDSKYVIDSMTKWLEGWKKKGWKTAGKKPVKNMDMIYWLDKLLALHCDVVEFEFRHVSAHGKKEEPEDRRYGNDMADQFAVEGTEKSRQADC